MTEQSHQYRPMSDAELMRLVELAVARSADISSDKIAAGVARAFVTVGIDIDDPSQLREWHADMQWTRSARVGSSRLSLSLKTTIFGTLATATLFGLWKLLGLWKLIQIGQAASGQ